VASVLLRIAFTIGLGLIGGDSKILIAKTHRELSATRTQTRNLGLAKKDRLRTMSQSSVQHDAGILDALAGQKDLNARTSARVRTVQIFDRSPLEAGDLRAAQTTGQLEVDCRLEPITADDLCEPLGILFIFESPPFDRRGRWRADSLDGIRINQLELHRIAERAPTGNCVRCVRCAVAFERRLAVAAPVVAAKRCTPAVGEPLERRVCADQVDAGVLQAVQLLGLGASLRTRLDYPGPALAFAATIEAEIDG
jgi:hypothetical protein